MAMHGQTGIKLLWLRDSLLFCIVLSAIKDLETGFAGYSVISAAGAALLILVYIAAKKRDKMLEIAD